MDENESTTLSQILQAAHSEFLEKGYPAASLRAIAKKAGVTTGAFYGYFKNKEEIFDALVGEHYRYMLDLYRSLLAQFASLPPAEQTEHMVEYTTQSALAMTDYIYRHHDAFKLILCCSQGTKYDHFVHEMAELDVDATHNFAKATSEVGLSIKPVNSILEHMLTSGMFSTFFELVIHDVPENQAKEYVLQLLDFYSAGWAKIMGL